jgi:tetratricopeptide (TPR) repeat protein
MRERPLDATDGHHLRAAAGWLELGNHIEANAELENITPALRSHPDVLEIRWQIYAKESKWDACREIAAALLKQRPDLAAAWLHLSYSARRATGGGIQAAFDVLSPAAEKFPNVPTIPYNLACYTCQLGQLKEAWNWLEKAFDVAPNPGPLKSMALDDPDLEPLWLDIAQI